MLRLDEDVDMAGIFREQQELLDHFFRNFDTSQAVSLANEILACTGTVFFSGVGKSEFICSKISMSLASMDTRSVFLNPVNALHGDIGNCGPDDLLILFSKSGSTSELISLIHAARSKRVKVVSVTCSIESRLSQLSDVSVYLPLKRELCPFNLAPVTSAIIQLIFGDTLTAAMMRRQRITLETYAANHPAGTIGRRLTLTVRDVMKTGVGISRVSMDASLFEALLEISRTGTGCVLVTVGETLTGIFTDGDFRRYMAGGATDLTVSVLEHCSKAPLVIEDDCMRLADAEKMFHSGSKMVSCLPVLQTSATGSKVLVGLLTLAETVKALA